jgi:hypothetical protein
MNFRTCGSIFLKFAPPADEGKGDIMESVEKSFHSLMEILEAR